MNLSFYTALHGGPEFAPDNRTRLRWILADSFRKLAKSETKSMAAQLRHAAGVVEAGTPISKKSLSKIGTKRLSLANVIFNKLVKEKKNETTP